VLLPLSVNIIAEGLLTQIFVSASYPTVLNIQIMSQNKRTKMHSLVFSYSFPRNSMAPVFAFLSNSIYASTRRHRHFASSQAVSHEDESPRRKNWLSDFPVWTCAKLPVEESRARRWSNGTPARGELSQPWAGAAAPVAINSLWRSAWLLSQVAKSDLSLDRTSAACYARGITPKEGKVSTASHQHIEKHCWSIV